MSASEKKTKKRQQGITLMEILVGIALASAILLIVQILHSAMTRGGATIQDITEMQRQLKLQARAMKLDIASAGFGIDSIPVFETMNTSALKFIYVDVLNKYCPDSATAAVGYDVTGSKTLRKRIWCDAVLSNTQDLYTSPDSLALTFTYRDRNGAITGTSDEVSSVEYKLEMFSDRSGRLMEKQRFASGIVELRNN